MVVFCIAVFWVLFMGPFSQGFWSMGASDKFILESLVTNQKDLGNPQTRMELADELGVEIKKCRVSVCVSLPGVPGGFLELKGSEYCRSDRNMTGPAFYDWQTLFIYANNQTQAREVFQTLVEENEILNDYGFSIFEKMQKPYFTSPYGVVYCESKNCL